MRNHILVIFIAYLCIALTSVNSDEVQGCGGYVKSDVEINFSQVGIKLYTAQGSLKYETECAPNDGYYFMPVYDQGQYVIKVAPPSGWSVEPSKVAVTLDGQNDPCSRKEDINFHFKGFAVLGKVSSAASSNIDGPAGVSVMLRQGASLVLSTETSEGGHFVFTPLAAGDYTVSVAHPSWSFIAQSTPVSVADQNGEVPSGALVVRGYGAGGAVRGTCGEAAEGVAVVLYAPDQEALLKHFKQNPPGCTSSMPSGYAVVPSLGRALCHTVTGVDGHYSFKDLVPGRYTLAAFRRTPHTQFVLSPDSLTMEVGHGDVEIKDTFKLEGFTVRGRVVLGDGGAGVAGAAVRVEKTGQTVTTGQDGYYTLENVKPGKYSITVIADSLQFAPTSVTVTAASPVLVDIAPSHYTACFRVVLERVDQQQQQWTISVSSSDGAGVQQTVVTQEHGRGCTLLPPGQYTSRVRLTQQQQDRGIRFGPSEYTLQVSGSAALPELVFSQFLGEVSATVSCIQACPAVPLTLVASDGASKSVSASTVSKGAKKASATFKEIIPGQYQVVPQKEDWCWAQKSVPAEVNTQNVEVGLVQAGYLLAVTASHEATLAYTVQGTNTIGTVAVQKGTTKTCLSAPGVYTFTPESCHQFSTPSYQWNTAEPTLVSLVATHHTVTAAIHSSEEGAFKMQVTHEDGTTSQLEPSKASGKAYEFQFLAKENEEIVLTPKSSDNLFQYQPTSFTMMVPMDCVSNVITFKAEKALFINGKVTPAVADIEITVESGEEKHLFTTDKTGSYKAGPLDNSLKYQISASLRGYMVNPLDDKGNFEAFKLAEVIVEIVDEEKKPLSGVVVSMSGGKSYRQNSLTGDDGKILFHSLLPGEYFLRSAMKEYNFQPPTKMFTVEQGASIIIKVSGLRVAYSALGSTMSLTGVLEPDVAVEARGRGKDCDQYQEEAVSDSNGAFRIRGLQPKCEYDLGLKSGEGLNQHIERMLPATTRVQAAGKDITGFKLVVLRYFNHLDVVGTVDTPNEFLSTISIKVYREDVADSPVHTIKITNHPFFMLPPMMADGKTYTLHLESSLSTLQYSYRCPEVSFVADASFKQVKLNFKPSLRNLDADMNQNTMAGLLLAIIIIGAMTNYDRIAPGIDWCLDIIGTFIVNRGSGGGQGSSHGDFAKKMRTRGRRNS